MRRLTVVAVGGKQSDWAREAEREYCKRLSAWNAQVVSVKMAQGPKARELESKRILAQVPAKSAIVAAQPGVAGLTTEDFARRLRDWMTNGGASFIIGGADGLGTDVLEQSDATVSLSCFTLSHGVARVLLLEQCYRCWTILNGHPYHRS